MNFRVNVELLLLEVKYFLKQRVYLASFKFAFNLLLVILQKFSTNTCISNMFVGSSSNSKSGRQKRARAKASLILQPPEKLLVGCFCISVVKPRPSRITLALDVAWKITKDCYV